MDLDHLKKYIIAAFVIILVCTLCNVAGRVTGKRIGYEKGYAKGYEDGWNAPHPADTLVVTDTLRVDKPVPQYVYLDRTVYVPVHDTTLVHHNDTAFVVLPREVKGYADSTYRCEVSGVEPRLDWIEVFQRTQTITHTVVETAPRWSLGLTAGPGVVWNPNGFHGGVGLTLGLQYRF